MLLFKVQPIIAAIMALSSLRLAPIYPLPDHASPRRATPQGAASAPWGLPHLLLADPYHPPTPPPRLPLTPPPPLPIPHLQRARYCPAPPGDSLTRKSLFDALVAGCVPVIFSRASLEQYKWFLTPKVSSPFLAPM